MHRSIAILGLFAVVVLGAPAAGAGANDDLHRVVAQMRSLDDADFAQVATWSQTGAARPLFVFDPAQAAQHNIIALRPEHRDAILTWLRGRGRSSLYRLGLTDADIGPRRNAIEDAGPPSNTWRELTLAAPALAAAAAGNITVERGFAAAKLDGTAVTACITFRNAGAKVANRIVFEFPLLGEDSAVLGVLTLDRRGTFSPGVAIAGYAAATDLSGNTIGPRGRSDNCVTQSNAIAAFPILEARFASYRITRVEYADASVWTP